MVKWIKIQVPKVIHLSVFYCTYPKTTFLHTYLAFQNNIYFAFLGQKQHLFPNPSSDKLFFVSFNSRRDLERRGRKPPDEAAEPANRTRGHPELDPQQRERRRGQWQ